jgi:hypothetical protein
LDNELERGKPANDFAFKSRGEQYTSTDHKYDRSHESSNFLSNLITIKVDVVDAHFASLNAIHYLIQVLVSDLQPVADQRACSSIDSAVGCEFLSASF